MKNNIASKFVSRLVSGSLVAIFLGKFLDESFHTSPWIMIVLLVYAVGGSLYMLVKESSDETS